MPRTTQRTNVTGLALACAVLLASGAIATSKAHAQSTNGDPEEVKVELVNGTTGEAGTAERILIEYISARRNVVLDLEPPGALFTLEDVPLRAEGKYIVTLWSDGVPYFFSRKGRQLRDEVQLYHVFDTSTSLENVAVEGMTVVLHREESVVEVEVMLQVRNDAKPQVTVTAPLVIGLGQGLSDVEAEYQRGLDPTPVPARISGGDVQLPVPLVSGMNRLRLTGRLAWREGLPLTVGANLAVEAWDLILAPEWMEADTFELEGEAATVAGIRRYRGPALEAGRRLAFGLKGNDVEAGEAEDLFVADADPTAGDNNGDGRDAEQGGGPPYLLIVGVMLALLVAAVWFRRR